MKIVKTCCCTLAVTLCMDGVHPNDEAFAHMASTLAPVISGLIK